MADEELYPDVELSTSGLSGDVQDLRENDTAAWYTADDPDSGDDVTGAWSMDDTGADLEGEQPVRFYIRHTGNGNGEVEYELELSEDGNTVETIDSGIISSDNTSGSEFSGSFDSSNISDPDNLDMLFSADNSGGMPGSRDVAEIAFITWDADYQVFINVTTLEPANVSTDSAVLEGEVSWEGGSLDVYFEWRQTGATTWNTTSTQTFTNTGTFVVDNPLDLDEAEEYEYRIFADIDDGDETDTGSTISFWTLLGLAGTATLDGEPVEGASITVLDADSDEHEVEVSTGSDGSYSIEVPGHSSYHVLASYEDEEGVQFNEKSKPFLNKE